MNNRILSGLLCFAFTGMMLSCATDGQTAGGRSGEKLVVSTGPEPEQRRKTGRRMSWEPWKMVPLFFCMMCSPCPILPPEALDIIIPELKAQGYEFVTLSELFERKGIDPDQDGVMWVYVQ